MGGPGREDPALLREALVQLTTALSKRVEASFRKALEVCQGPPDTEIYVVARVFTVPSGPLGVTMEVSPPLFDKDALNQYLAKHPVGGMNRGEIYGPVTAAQLREIFAKLDVPLILTP